MKTTVFAIIMRFEDWTILITAPVQLCWLYERARRTPLPAMIIVGCGFTEFTVIQKELPQKPWRSGITSSSEIYSNVELKFQT